MPTIGPNLDWHKAQAVKRINAAIGEARLQYITDMPGQEAIYQAKEAEAVDYLETQPATLDDYPLLSAEVGITADTAGELALLWVGMATQWRQTAAVLEGVRMTATAAVGGATTRAGINTALDDFRAALAALS